jgi:hypothetical protein
MANEDEQLAEYIRLLMESNRDRTIENQIMAEQLAELTEAQNRSQALLLQILEHIAYGSGYEQPDLRGQQLS